MVALSSPAANNLASDEAAKVLIALPLLATLPNL